MARAAERGGGGRLPLSRGQMIFVALVVLGGALIGWQGYKQVYGDGSSRPAPVTTYTVEPTTIRQTATTSGTVVAPANSKLTFAEAGRIATINVKQGQNVKQGDVIATLDPTTLQLAVQQAQSAVTTAQASLDALEAPPTQDVEAAAQQGVTSAQAGVTTAQSTLQQAQNGQTSANASVGTAQNGVATAQDTYNSALNTITSDQAAIQTAQNNLQALLNGPTSQQIAVAQASVDSAQTALNTAQDNYNRLINHTDIATRPETTALISASAAYQQALANLANAEPQAANPYDVQSAQNAVQTAAAAVTTAQQSAGTAQQSLLQAQITAACDTPPYDNAALCPIGTNANPGAASSASSGISNDNSSNTSGTGGSCTLSPGVDGLPPCNVPQSGVSPSSQQSAQLAAQQALTTAQNAATTAAQGVVTAQNNYQSALIALQKLLNPINTTDLSGQQAAVAAAQANLQVAQTNYDNYVNNTNVDIAPETTALNSAQSSYNTAVANYNNTVAPAKDTDISNAQNAIQTAQAQLASAQNAANSAGTSISTAQNAVTTAQQTANNAASTINSSAAGIDNANAALQAAQAKLAQTNAGPLSTDVTKAQEAVKEAQEQLQSAQLNLQQATLTAPFSGQVVAVTANPGDELGSGTEVVQLVDTSHIELDAAVDETTYGSIAVGMPVVVTFDAVPGQTFSGFITTIVSSGTTTQGVVTYPIVIALTAQPNGQLPPAGASASQITVIIKADQNVLAVPSNYIYRSGTNQVVDLYQNGKRVPTVVTTGDASDTTRQTQITSGLKQGDVIAAPVKKTSGSASASGAGGAGIFGGGGGGGGGGAVRGG